MPRLTEATERSSSSQTSSSSVTLRINNQQDTSSIQNFYFVTILYMFRASSVPIIRSYQLYTWQLVCFMLGMWPLPRRVRLQLSTADNSWWWAQKMPETCRDSWQNKNFGYLMHLVGYLYEDITMHVHLNIKFFSYYLEPDKPVSCPSIIYP
jgi:hypothetical protein